MIGSLVLLAGLLAEGAGLALELQARLPPTGGAELLTIIFSNATLDLARCEVCVNTSVGGVSYTGFNPDGWGIKSDVLFNFDLPLEPAFRPACVDGEVAEFKLMPVADVAELLASPEPLFKPNVGVVLIDFMVRHGFVDPDEEGYIELMGALRSGVALSGAGRPEGSSVIPN